MDLDEYIEKLAEVRDGLEEKIQVAHGQTKDLTHLLRELDAVVKRAEHFLDALIKEKLEDVIEKEVTRQLKELGDAVAKEMEESVDKVGREFNRLERIFTGKEHAGQTPLEFSIQKARERDLGLTPLRPKHVEINDPTTATGKVKKLKKR